MNVKAVTKVRSSLIERPSRGGELGSSTYCPPRLGKEREDESRLLLGFCCGVMVMIIGMCGVFPFFLHTFSYRGTLCLISACSCMR